MEKLDAFKKPLKVKPFRIEMDESGCKVNQMLSKQVTVTPIIIDHIQQLCKKSHSLKQEQQTDSFGLCCPTFFIYFIFLLQLRHIYNCTIPIKYNIKHAK